MTANTLNITEVAKAAGVTRPTIYAWWKDGKIPVDPIAGSKPPRFPTIEICGWLGIDQSKLNETLGR